MAGKNKSGSKHLLKLSLKLLTLLSASLDKPVKLEQARKSLNCSEDELKNTIDLLLDLSDENSGSRLTLSMDDAETEITLAGGGGELPPVRLSTEEGVVLSYVLSISQIDTDTRQRIEKALLPVGVASLDNAAAEAITEATPKSPYFQQLSDAIQIGARLKVSYRKDIDPQPRSRILDPLCLTSEGSTTYLIAWDVEKDDQRRYRLDRIESVEDTGESADPHDWVEQTVGEGLRARGTRATLLWESEDALRCLDWAGLGEVTPHPTEDNPHAVEAEVSYAGESWLFDQVLGSGGAGRILAPESLVDSFAAYARSLLIGTEA